MRKISNSRIYTFPGGGGTMPYLLPGTYLDRFKHDIIISNDEMFSRITYYYIFVKIFIINAAQYNNDVPHRSVENLCI